jgi:RimJ/RimL family protein N-acetyltransferase
LKAGRFYRQFQTKLGKKIILRAIRWEDLSQILEFANRLVEERDSNPDLGIILDRRQTLESEARWLGEKLASIELGNQVSVVAETEEGTLVGNSEVTRGSSSDEFHHGKLGISVLKEYRNQGIGLEMMKTLVQESQKAGLKTIELEVFANNPQAYHIYEKAGFKQVGRIPKKIFRLDRFVDVVVMAIEL